MALHTLVWVVLFDIFYIISLTNASFIQYYLNLNCHGRLRRYPLIWWKR